MMLARGDPSFDSKWLAHVMNSRVGRYQFEVVQYGAAQEQFNIGHAVDFQFPVPPLPEQRRIVTHIETETARLDALRAEAKRTIELLKERRSALIAAAVTGELEVN
jgi:type I restriction enzyme S subunit